MIAYPQPLDYNSLLATGKREPFQTEAPSPTLRGVDVLKDFPRLY